MTTRAGLRQLVRDELNDNGATKLWADGLLNAYIGEAVREYGRELPREVATTIVVVAGQAAYALPADFVEARRVEQPALVRRLPGERDGAGYRVWAGQIVLVPAPAATGAAEDVRLEYLARYAEPAADGDTLSTPAGDDDLLVALVAARALEWISTDEAKRQRFERDRGASAAGEARRYRVHVAAELELRRRVVRTTTLERTE